jgi:hypothetical protein
MSGNPVLQHNNGRLRLVRRNRGVSLNGNGAVIAAPEKGRRMNKDDWFRAAGKVGYGRLAVDAGLGFDEELCPRICGPFDLNGWHTISAHADSDVVFQTGRPVEIFGFLNCSATSDRANPVSFWVSRNRLGEAASPGDRTRSIKLSAGKFALAATCGGRNDSRHSVWAFRESQSSGSIRGSSGRSGANPDNTALVTIAAYPAHAANQQISRFTTSCVARGCLAHVFGIGEGYGHFYSKIERMRTWIGELPRHYRHVLYVDGRDALLARPLEAACAAFNEIKVPIVMSAEAGCWPIFDDQWRERFPAKVGNRCWPNAGVWMGERHALLNALDVMVRLKQQLEAEITTTGVEDIWYLRNRYQDDQFLWQICYLKKLFPLHLDAECRIAANVSTMDRRLFENKDFEFNAGLKVKETDTAPSVLHFSGPASHECMDQWAGYLGLL